MNPLDYIVVAVVAVVLAVYAGISTVHGMRKEGVVKSPWLACDSCDSCLTHGRPLKNERCGVCWGVP